MASSIRSFTLPQAQQLAAHAASLEPPARPLRLGIVHTYTSALLDPWLELAAALQGFALNPYHAPYGLALQETEPGSGLLAHQPEVTLLLLRWEDLHPALGQPLVGTQATQRDALKADVVSQFCGIVGQFRAQKVGHLVATLLPPLFPSQLGMYDLQAEGSTSAWWATLKADIARAVRETMPASLFLDLDEIVRRLGRDAFFDRRLWYSSRFPFSPAAAREVATTVVAVAAVRKHPKAKVIVLDADNTLWGGVIGEDGIHGIALGPDYPGNVFVDFQRRLLEYQRRGFILALCSKNNPADVDAVLSEHPHQLLRDDHFAARRVNWLSKTDNLVDLAEELNLGLDSFVFVDDSPHECAAVRQRLPEVEVVQTPGRAVDIPSCLDHVARLEVLSLTEEDLVKTELYAQDRRRREFQERSASSLGPREYLESLNMKMRVGVDDLSHLQRLSQLTQKTNQFNLTGQRYDDARMRQLMLDPSWLVAHFSLADIFGDSGIVGLAIFQRSSAREAVLDTFLMSCRVIGREAESAFLNALLRRLADEGLEEVIATYTPTPKNMLVKDFLPAHGFKEGPDGHYRRNLHREPPSLASAYPIAIEA